jgi:hypothetical protein
MNDTYPTVLSRSSRAPLPARGFPTAAADRPNTKMAARSTERCCFGTPCTLMDCAPHLSAGHWSRAALRRVLTIRATRYGPHQRPSLWNLADGAEISIPRRGQLGFCAGDRTNPSGRGMHSGLTVRHCGRLGTSNVWRRQVAAAMPPPKRVGTPLGRRHQASRGSGRRPDGLRPEPHCWTRTRPSTRPAGPGRRLTQW